MLLLQGQAVLASMSIGNLMKAVELLYGMQCFSLCAMFIEACTELELLELTDQTCILISATNPAVYKYCEIKKGKRMGY